MAGSIVEKEERLEQKEEKEGKKIDDEVSCLYILSNKFLCKLPNNTSSIFHNADTKQTPTTSSGK